jgi:hypothetical protein
MGGLTLFHIELPLLLTENTHTQNWNFLLFWKAKNQVQNSGGDSIPVCHLLLVSNFGTKLCVTLAFRLYGSSHSCRMQFIIGFHSFQFVHT